MRKSKPKKRILLPDPKFNDVLVTRFVNDLMVDGKKSIAFRIFYDAIDIVDEKMAKKEEKPALDIWKQALENITPQVEVKSRRVGGATFQVPMEINPMRKRAISVKNMILFSRKRSGRNMAEKSWLHTRKKERLSRRKRIFIVWLKPTELLHISDFN